MNKQAITHTVGKQYSTLDISTFHCPPIHKRSRDNYCFHKVATNKTEFLHTFVSIAIHFRFLSLAVNQRKIVLMKNRTFAMKFVSLATFCWSLVLSNACDQSQLFEGFGIYLGSMDNFALSSTRLIPQVLDRIYNDLGIR